jgi:hypothetical protein
MSDFSKLPWLGLAWLVLVGIVASLAGECGPAWRCGGRCWRPAPAGSP